MFRHKGKINSFKAFSLSCLIARGHGGGGGWVKLQILGKKNVQIHLVIAREGLKTPPPILRNLDNFPSGAFYSTPPPSIRHKRVPQDVVSRT